jgi:putative transposase
MCRVLRVSRSGFYATQRRAPSARARADARLQAEVRAVHALSRRTYGSPRVHAELRARGRRTSRKRIARLMRAEGLAARRRRRHRVTTRSRHGHPVAPNVLARRFAVGAPNQAWAGDITYLPTREGRLYLAVLLDLGSRRVVGWALRMTLDRGLTLAALARALATRRLVAGGLHHSDRGSQYAREEYRGLLAAHGEHESARRLLRQRGRRELLRNAQAGARRGGGLGDAGRGGGGGRRLPRGLVQPAAAALSAGLPEPGDVRTAQARGLSDAST